MADFKPFKPQAPQGPPFVSLGYPKVRWCPVADRTTPTAAGRGAAGVRVARGGVRLLGASPRLAQGVHVGMTPPSPSSAVPLEEEGQQAAPKPAVAGAEDVVSEAGAGAAAPPLGTAA